MRKAFLAIALLGGTAFASAAANAQETVKIGLVQPLTGSVAYNGTTDVNGARLAADERNAKPCPVAVKGCSTCHMPKIELPGSHFKFTDHRIRVARAGDTFPN